MNNIIHNLTQTKELSVVQTVLLRKIGSTTTPPTYKGLTVKKVVPHNTGSVNLVIVTQTSPELYIVYYDNSDMNKATSECVVQINFANNQINLTETVNGQALVREYKTNKSQTCQNIIKHITTGDQGIVYNLSQGKNTYPVHKNSIIDKLNTLLSKLALPDVTLANRQRSNSPSKRQNTTSNSQPKPSSSRSNSPSKPSNTTSNLVNVANVLAKDPAAQALASAAKDAAVASAAKALSDSPKAKAAYDIFKTVSENPLAQQLAAVAANAAMSAATAKLSNSPRGQKALQMANVAKGIYDNNGQNGGKYTYVNLANINV